ncbi:Holliday junction resolvase RecU [Enterococcus wangshanyuanii]|uniref:Holliday junction resolvase RecU n=1 Tax=Enterococcus wangshanyuanii TaxID=2005703 RepID=A0ABQ1P029_9ENTE|nr:Holliday junction resolvase RecU [Enterococcus wangshanyuanii]GGC88231.1 hypothetical protein GCM10011573_17300 [Enterococcus wangshanyuanii]
MTEKKYSKSEISKMNNERGKRFEKMILAGCSHYQKKQIAKIGKTPEPFSFKKKLPKGQFVGQFRRSEKAQPDFAGTLNTGRSIIFEAKTTHEDQISQSVVSKNQADELDIHLSLGAYAGVCVEVNKTVAFVPWIIWKNMDEFYGRKFMTEKELKAYAVETPGHILFLNYVNSNPNNYNDYKLYGGLDFANSV